MLLARTPFLLLAVALAASPALAQRGFSFTPHVYGTGIIVGDVDDGEAEEGGGLGFRAGLGVSKTVTLYLSGGGARIDSDGGATGVVRDLEVADLGRLDDTYTVASGGIGAQFNLLPSGVVNPFLRTELTGTQVIFDAPGTDDRDDPRLVGGGLTLGVGAEVRLSRKLAIEAALHATGGRFDELQTRDVDYRNFEDVEFGSGQVEVGLTWRPWAKTSRRDRDRRRNRRH